MQKSGIKIHGKRAVENSDASWDELDFRRTTCINLAAYVTDSTVGKVHLATDCVQAITNWVDNSLSEVTPEVGGLLLGYYQQTTEDQYELFIETFVPFREVLSQSAVKLSAGFAYAYNEALEKHEDAMVVGWFHTHPGHTPYLSATDLNQTHYPFFKQDYQIAIVLDSLTHSYDTGIFSRKQDGSMNNAADYSQWIRWKNILDQKNQDNL